MSSITKPIGIESISSTFSDYLYSSSPPDFNFGSMFSSYDPLLRQTRNNTTNSKNNVGSAGMRGIRDSGNTEKRNTNTSQKDMSSGGFIDVIQYHNKTSNNNCCNYNCCNNNCCNNSCCNKKDTIHLNYSFYNPYTNNRDNQDDNCPHLSTPTTDSMKYERTNSYPHSAMRSPRLKDAVPKKVCFADDKGKALEHVKVFTDGFLLNRSISFPKRRERRSNGSRIRSDLSLFDICPSVVFDIQNMKLDAWGSKDKSSNFAYYAQFAQPCNNHCALMSKLQDGVVKLHSASLKNVDGSADGSYGGGGVVCEGEGRGEIGGEGGEDGSKIMFNCKVLVKSDSRKKEVFVRMTCNKWKSFEDLEAKYVSDTDSIYSFVLSINLSTSFDGKEIKKKEYASNSSKNASKSISEYLPEPVEFAICFRGEEGESWDNNEANNYRFCRFYR